MIILAILVGVVIVVLIVAVVAYNRFVQQRQYIDNAWANVETELRRRYDLIPNLVETVKGYASHESRTLEAVTPSSSERGRPTTARRPSRPPPRTRSSERLQELLRRVRGLPRAEGEPELPRPAAAADRHRGSHPGGAPLLQQQRSRLQRARAVGAVQRRRPRCSASKPGPTSTSRRPCTPAARPKCHSNRTESGVRAHHDCGLSTGSIRHERGRTTVGRPNRSHAIRRPRCRRRLTERAEADRAARRSSPPAGEVAPGLLPIVLQGYADLGQVVEQGLELGP